MGHSQRRFCVSILATAALCMFGCFGGDDAAGRRVSPLCEAEGCVDEEVIIEPDGIDGPDDWDDDGIKNWDDNCPNNPNNGVENGNEESEVLEGGTESGDACDPYPVGDTQVFGWMSLNGGVRSVTTDQVIVDTHRGNDFGIEFETGLRFCRCSVGREDTAELRGECHVQLADGTGLCVRDDPVSYYGGDSAWRQLTTTWIVEEDNEACGAACDPMAPVRYGPPGRFFDEEVTFDWDIAANAEAWGEFIDGMGNFEMPGVLWTHVPGPWNEPDYPLANRKLQNHYLSMIFTKDQSGYVDDVDNNPVGPFMGRSGMCPHCEEAFPVPSLAWAPCFGQIGCGDVPEIRFVDGAWDATAMFASGATNGLGQIQGTWIVAGEPDDLLHADGARYAAVKTDGTQVNAVLNLGPSGWAKVVPPTPGTKPAARSEFGAVLSAEQSRVYVVGGVSGGGSLLQDLWAYNLSSQTWSQVTLSGSYRPARVLAAAYAPFEDKLIVLDKVISGGTTTYRILRVPVAGGAPTVAGSWTRTTSAVTSFALSAEPWGMGYVVACGTSTAHRILVFGRTGPSSLSLVQNRQGTGTLANRNIRVDEIGITLIVPGTGGILRPVGYVMEDLPSGGSTGLCF